ncbi:hypothetical protein E2C01_000368 [Portunus trituberculatus]|uniref:Uncharacterized protein n=1 Tax=Portunus trituberculatus TaxID=210409 RepID=A0A5B7CGA5_PORTR|nr:hypothetical protein [Portunus trituberculatus]
MVRVNGCLAFSRCRPHRFPSSLFLLREHHTNIFSGYILKLSGTCIQRQPVQHNLTVEITTIRRIKNSVRGESARDRRRLPDGAANLLEGVDLRAPSCLPFTPTKAQTVGGGLAQIK